MDFRGSVQRDVSRLFDSDYSDPDCSGGAFGGASGGSYRNAVAEDSTEYGLGEDVDGLPGGASGGAANSAGHEGPHETLTGRFAEAEAIRLAMALVEGARHATADRAEKVQQLREHIRRISGQQPDSDEDNEEAMGHRLRSLSRTRDRNLAEQLRLQVRFDEAGLYRRDGCRSMIVWMDVHLGIAKTNASEQLRVGRALQDLPVLESLFTLGQISFSQLREVTRVATAQTDAEFALATLALSVSETREYCLRFRHDADRDEDARLAAQHGQEVSEAHAALRAYERRSLSVSEPDAYTTRIVLELPRELGEEFRRSLEQCEDWIREGGEDPEPADIIRELDQQADTATAGIGDQVTSSSKPTATQLRADAALLMSRRSLALAGEAVAMADRYRVHVNVDLSQLLDTGDGRVECSHGGDQAGGDGGCDCDGSCDGGCEPGCKTASSANCHGPSQHTDNIIERPWLHGAGPIPRASAQRLAEIAGFTLIARDEYGEAFATADKAPPFSKRQLKTLRARDRRCQMPGCGSTRHAEGHHIVHRENGGRSTMENAVYVCGACHRLLHEGGFRLERIGPNGADLGLHAQVLNADEASRRRAQAKVSRIRRYRLYGPDGREYDSVNAARAGLARQVEGGRYAGVQDEWGGVSGVSDAEGAGIKPSDKEDVRRRTSVGAVS